MAKFSIEFTNSAGFTINIGCSTYATKSDNLSLVGFSLKFNTGMFNENHTSGYTYHQH